MVSTPSTFDRLQSPRVALVLNAALAVTGVALTAFDYVDFVAGVIVAAAGLLGVGISLIGRQPDE